MDRKILSISCMVAGSLWFMEIVASNQQVFIGLCLSGALIWAGKKFYPPY